MKAKRDILLNTSLILDFCLSGIGFSLTVHHGKGADVYLILGFIFHLAWLTTALYEIFRSSRISKTEKNIWTIVLVLSGSIGGLIYILLLRKNINQTLDPIKN
jgi:hypothetical protein